MLHDFFSSLEQTVFTRRLKYLYKFQNGSRLKTMQLCFVKTRVAYKIMFSLYKMFSSVGDETFGNSFVTVGLPIAEKQNCLRLSIIYWAHLNITLHFANLYIKLMNLWTNNNYNEVVFWTLFDLLIWTVLFYSLFHIYIGFLCIYF